jgi:hypothetical protein
MATTITDRKNLPDNAQPIAEQIEKLGFKWTFDYQYPIPSPDKTQRVQIRANPAPSSEVTKYAAAMKRGDVFPPGVVTKDGRFVDFNTRSKAAWKTGRRDYPVFVLNAVFEGATESERERLYLLGAAFNTHGPKPLTRTELAEAVSQIKGRDWTAERVAALLGVTQSRVNIVFAQRKAEQRAERLGISFNGSVNPSNRALLGQRGEKLNDPPFAAIASLAQDAGLTGEELRDLCNRVQAVSGSDDERVALVNSEREARQAQIDNYRATARRKPPLSSEMLKRTRYIEGFAGSAGELVDYNPNTGESYLRSVERAALVLDELAQAQREENAKGASG